MDTSTRIELYQVDAKGKMREWAIWANDNIIYIEHGLQNGAKQLKEEIVRVGLAGRTLNEQIALRVRSRINKQFDRGYKNSPGEALRLKGTNALGMYRPMKAQPLKKVKNIDYLNAFVQHKYDGHRCLIANIAGEKIAYSSEGKLIRSIDHILGGVYVREGETIDGELYCHGVNLQTIGSWIKREQDASKNLMFHAYDMVSREPFNERIDRLRDMIIDPKVAVAVPTAPIHSSEEVSEMFIHSREQGYEGSILRWGQSGYEVGKRSASLVKIKKTADAEAKVIGVIPSKDGWGILECETHTGIYFKMPAPGSYTTKEEVWLNKEQYIGRYVTFEYANLTADGVPFHPNALRFREDI